MNWKVRELYTRRAQTQEKIRERKRKGKMWRHDGGERLKTKYKQESVWCD